MCVCVCVCVVYEDTNLYNDMGITNRYYKEKVIYEDIFSVLIIQNAYKSYRVSFFGGKVEMHRLLWGISLGVGKV